MDSIDHLIAAKDSEALRRMSDSKTDDGARVVEEDGEWLREFAEHFGQLLDACGRVTESNDRLSE